ncbi:MAG: M48 family metallopeptidase [Hyphomicrobiaceae bacterium]|nr:M48 family metallopeptidase [Hyphomicrobiaceae bacterium]
MARAKASASPSRLNAEDLSALDADVEVRRHPSARRLTLRVSRTRRAVIVTLPMKCDLVEAGSFISRNIDWVRERLGSIPEPVPFTDTAMIPLRGEPHRLVFAGAATRRAAPVEIETVDGAFPQIVVNGMTDHAPRRLIDWLFEQARRDLDVAVQRHARTLGLAARRIAVRDQASRWGSCSTTGTLSFSWRLILAPPLILDYVAAHEVAHLAEMNHGPRFWSLVQRTMPRLDEAKNWLQIYGMDLHRYGPATVLRR